MGDRGQVYSRTAEKGHSLGNSIYVTTDSLEPHIYGQFMRSEPGLYSLSCRYAGFSETGKGVSIEFESRYEEKACTLLSTFALGHAEIALIL
jgi:hypothetical protein